MANLPIYGYNLPPLLGDEAADAIRDFVKTGDFKALQNVTFRHVAEFLETGQANMERLKLGAADVRYTLEDIQQARAAGVSARACAQKVLDRRDNAANFNENDLGVPLVTASNCGGTPCHAKACFRSLCSAGTCDYSLCFADLCSKQLCFKNFGIADFRTAFYVSCISGLSCPPLPGTCYMILLRKFIETHDSKSLQGSTFRYIAEYLETGEYENISSLATGAADIRYTVEDIQAARADGITATEFAQMVLKQLSDSE